MKDRMTVVGLFWMVVTASLIGTVMASSSTIPTESLSPILSKFRGGAAISYRLKRRRTDSDDNASLPPPTASPPPVVDDQTPSIPTTTTTTTKTTKQTKKSSSSTAQNAVEENRMPSIFITADERQYDRYAACLAATESLRKARDLAILKKKPSSSSSSSPSSSTKKLLFGRNKNGIGGETYGIDTIEYKRAQAQYLLQSTKVIRALGLTVSQFNQMGREIGNDEGLKEKVMEQAFLYRMAATVDLKKVPLIEFPQSEKLLKSQRKARIEMFARSMTEIEDLRTEQIERLRKALHVDRLPEGVNICDPAIRPILSPKVRAVVEAFPLQAETIVKKYGLNSDEFNQMLEETKSNPIFRWKVKSYMGKNNGNKGKGKEKN